VLTGPPPTPESADPAAPGPVTAVRRLHDVLSRTASGGVVDPRGAAAYLPPPGTGEVRLPEPDALPPLSLGDVLDARRSSYAFGQEQPDAVALSTLLQGALGPRRSMRTGDGTVHVLGAAPSAGGLASLDPWLVARGPGPVPPGVHRVLLDGGRPRLRTTRVGDPTRFWSIALDQPQFARGPTMTLALVARLDVTLAKYPPRHYRTLHVDAGVALQNLYLVATTLALPCCAVMGFDDDAVGRLLELGDEAFVTVLFVCGSAGTR
jgi:SagB-type dehydrogenase family enzyme